MKHSLDMLMAACLIIPAMTSAHGETGLPFPETGTADGVRVSVRKGAPQSLPSPEALKAWHAFQAGDLVTAHTEYRKALNQEPRNTDVLHGLAAIALRQNRQEEARQLYRVISELAPRDPLADIYAAAAMDSNRESRLKALAADTDSPVPLLALGLMYAGDQRWGDAEHAYRQALALMPESPDCHYNLAVTLEHLGQKGAALKHYRSAISFSERGAFTFDGAKVRARLTELEVR